MVKNIVCPDIQKEDSRNRYNFSLKRCQERFQMRADGCVKCPVGTHWFVERMMQRR